ncbi:hypothetical protein [Stieleria marina]|uniref:Nickel uptake substrate-specific transmembrane region n=1 Tax=Stieleria marina TaxID=1930275 RepID=A0A517NP21_9BACT|nr:hypothetical protein K239x_08120 [Planctomycetes bacterium K23_9]
MPHTTRCFAVLVLWISVACLYADTPENPIETKSIDQNTMTDLVVLLQDEDGKPVEDAAVKVYAMRMQEGGGHGYWNSEKLGLPKSVISDKEGRAVVRYPAKVASTPHTMTTRLVTFSVSHYEYVQQIVHFDLGPDKAEVTLKKGCEINLSAVDNDNQPISNFGVMIAGPYDPTYWVDDKATGGRRTGAASDGTWQTMLVKPQDDGATLFSSVMPLRVRPSQAVRIRNLKMKPGTRVEGRLSDNVPRPIKNGFAITCTAPKPAGDSWNEQDPSVTWKEWTAINEDGTFVLKSIPHSGKVQIIAVCDDWVSVTEPKHRAFVKGQLFEVDEDIIHPTVEMEKTGTLEVAVTDQDGKPFTGGKVSSWPNQQYYLGGSTILGRKNNSLLLIENQIRPIDQKKQIDYRIRFKTPFSDQPIEKGNVTLKGLPIGMSDSIMLVHEEYIFDTEDGKSDPNRASIRFLLDSVEPEKIEVKVKKK